MYFKECLKHQVNCHFIFMGNQQYGVLYKNNIFFLQPIRATQWVNSFA